MRAFTEPLSVALVNCNRGESYARMVAFASDFEHTTTLRTLFSFTTSFVMLRISTIPLAVCCLVWTIGSLNAQTSEDTSTQVTEGVINVPIAKVWEVFSSKEGWKKLGVAKADNDFRIGGLIRTHYDANGTLGDETGIQNQIMAYDPMKMLAFRIHKAPKTFPFPNAMKNTWTVIYLESLGPNQTKLTLRGVGYTEDKESQEMRQFFQRGNQWTMEHLKKQLEENSK